jgi:hypothetical protein
MDVNAITVVKLPWQCRYHIHIYWSIDDLPYNTISSHLMSQSSDLHKRKPWGPQAFRLYNQVEANV